MLCITDHDNISDTKEQHEERQAQLPTNLHTCHHKTTRERAAASSSEQQEGSGAVTSSAANMATGMTDSAGSKTCGEKMGGEESSKISDNRADSPNADYDDTADLTKPSNNTGTIIDQKQEDPHIQDNTAAINPEQAERIARNRQAALERADERRREQQVIQHQR